MKIFCAHQFDFTVLLVRSVVTVDAYKPREGTRLEYFLSRTFETHEEDQFAYLDKEYSNRYASLGSLLVVLVAFFANAFFLQNVQILSGSPGLQFSFMVHYLLCRSRKALISRSQSTAPLHLKLPACAT